MRHFFLPPTGINTSNSQGSIGKTAGVLFWPLFQTCWWKFLNLYQLRNYPQIFMLDSEGKKYYGDLLLRKYILDVLRSKQCWCLSPANPLKGKLCLVLANFFPSLGKLTLASYGKVPRCWGSRGGVSQQGNHNDSSFCLFVPFKQVRAAWDQLGKNKNPTSAVP